MPSKSRASQNSELEYAASSIGRETMAGDWEDDTSEFEWGADCNSDHGAVDGETAMASSYKDDDVHGGPDDTRTPSDDKDPGIERFEFECDSEKPGNGVICQEPRGDDVGVESGVHGEEAELNCPFCDMEVIDLCCCEPCEHCDGQPLWCTCTRCVGCGEKQKGCICRFCQHGHQGPECSCRACDGCGMKVTLCGCVRCRMCGGFNNDLQSVELQRKCECADCSFCKRPSQYCQCFVLDLAAQEIDTGYQTVRVFRVQEGQRSENALQLEDRVLVVMGDEWQAVIVPSVSRLKRQAVDKLRQACKRLHVYWLVKGLKRLWDGRRTE